MPTTLIQIFRDSETHHHLSFFDIPALKVVEALLFEKNGKPYLKATQAIEIAIEKNEAVGTAALRS